MKPLISIIIPTFNRATTIERTINSLLKQTYDNLEIVIVEDGSTDNTEEIISTVTDPRVKIIRHKVNKGVSAAKNTGLNHIKGEWFSILDSDDELLCDALGTMMQIPLEKDPSVNSVTCNCLDTSTGKFSGKIELEADHYMHTHQSGSSSGEFWGITKSELVLNDRFNERLIGFESTLWYKINKRVKGYYIHKALRIYHTEGDDRVSHVFRKASPQKTSIHFQALSEETHFLEENKKSQPKKFARDCTIAIIYLIADNKKEYARFYYNELKSVPKHYSYKAMAFLVFHSSPLMMKVGLKLLALIKSIR